MRTIPIAAAAAIAILSGTALAQSPSTPSTQRSPSPSATQAPIAREPAPNPLTKEDVSNIEGTTVYGNDGRIGSISTILMDPGTKKIDRLVVTAGGVLGVGGHRVAIPLEKFSWDADKAGFKLSTTMADLKAMPEWVEGAATTATGSSQPPKKATPSTGAGDGELDKSSDKPAR
jgi:hypothetical protein